LAGVSVVVVVVFFSVSTGASVVSDFNDLVYSGSYACEHDKVDDPRCDTTTMLRRHLNEPWARRARSFSRIVACTMVAISNPRTGCPKRKMKRDRSGM